MKKRIPISLLVTILAVATVIPMAVPVGAVGEAGWWHFNEGTGSNAVDSSGNNNDGTVYATWVVGKAYTGLSFNGSDSRVEIDHSTSLNLTGSVTLEAWIYPTELPTLGNRDNIISKPDAYALQLCDAGKVRAWLGPLTPYFQTTDVVVVTDKWQLIVATYDGSTVSIYVDGVLKNSVIEGPSQATSLNKLVIGKRDPGSLGSNQGVVHGIIDEVRIYNSALSDIAVAALYDAAGPITSNVIINPNLVINGGIFNLTAVVDDTNTGASNIKSAEYSINGSDWSPMLASDGSFNELSEAVTATINAPAQAGVYNVCVRATDVIDNSGSSECIMLIVYDPSAGFVTGGGWIDSPSGAMGGSFNYPDQTLGNWQSGNFAEVFDLTQGDVTLRYTINMSGINTPGSSITEAGLRQVGAPNIDPNLQGGFLLSKYASSASGDIANTNDFHVLMTHGWDYEYYDRYGSFPGTDMAQINTWTFINHAFWFDRDGVDQWQATYWNYKDGITYNTAGIYEVVIQYHAIDASTGVMYATINGEFQGFYTGGYTSSAPPQTMPVGRTFTGDMTQMQVFFGRGGGGGTVALTDINVTGQLALSGKATFGFVSKYLKGATIPTGNTEFQFKAGNLNFKSTSYDWLVVTGSSYARYKGTGTINGTGEYKFMLWAGDGTGDNDADTFRIKIWTESDGVETVVYDNGMDQAIGGGNIVVHTGK